MGELNEALLDRMTASRIDRQYFNIQSNSNAPITKWTMSNCWSENEWSFIQTSLAMKAWAAYKCPIVCAPIQVKSWRPNYTSGKINWSSTLEIILQCIHSSKFSRKKIMNSADFARSRVEHGMNWNYIENELRKHQNWKATARKS